MKINFFEGLKRVADVKSLYRMLAMDNHPDRKPLQDRPRYNGIMQEINTQYHAILKSLHGEKTLDKETGKEREYKYNPVVEQHTMDALCKILSFTAIPDYVEINLVGTWIWIENVKKTDKEFIAHIKQSSVTDDTGWVFYFRWNGTRVCWQFNPTKWKGSKSVYGNDTIKAYYGTKEYKRSDETAIV